MGYLKGFGESEALEGVGVIGCGVYEGEDKFGMGEKGEEWESSQEVRLHEARCL